MSLYLEENVQLKPPMAFLKLVMFSQRSLDRGVSAFLFSHFRLSWLLVHLADSSM